MGVEQFQQPRLVGQVQALEGEVGQFFQLCQPSLLEVDVVIVAEVIDADDLQPGLTKAFGRVKPDKTCCTGNQNRHCVILQPQPVPDGMARQLPQGRVKQSATAACYP
ncbi:hypothetical protein D3C87_1792310 [compost metagenome]